MSSPWTSPDARHSAVGTTFRQPAERTASPPPLCDLSAGLLTVAVTVLVGAPVGLLWAALAPRVVVVVRDGQADLVDAYTDGFIAADAYYLAAVVLAGLVGGLLAWRLGAAHGPAVVLGLTLGGFAAAYVVMVVGGLAGGTPPSELAAAGGQGRHELAVRLRATSALVGWPLASLLGCLALAVREHRAGLAGAAEAERS